MKKLLASVLAVTCLAALFITGCSTTVYTIGSGPLVEKEYDYNDFDSIEIANNFQYQIRQSPDYSVKVTTHANLSEYLDVRQSHQTVYIGFAGLHSYSNTDAVVTINMPDLSSVKISGASRGSLAGFESNRPLKAVVSGASRMDLQAIAGDATINISGASKVTGYLKSQETEFIVSGASHCELKGSVANAKFNVSGASKAEMADMTVQSADVRVSGASRTIVNTDGDLSLNVSGASTVQYLGHPDIQNIQISGASHIERP